MTPSAIALFIFSATMLWGGLAWSIIRLRRFPELDQD
ncbi:MetS family NSS transporter small subunit [Corynebacterium pacaense]|nr:MetS family NSS transporter small subunit [Corynebacterium pacaense]